MKNVTMIRPKGNKQEKHPAGRTTPSHRVRLSTQKSLTGQGTL